MNDSGHKFDLNYCDKKRISKNRARNIIWFNPPFSANVKCSISKLFLDLIDKHFPKHNKLHKIFNRNNIKVSYSCMPNMNSIVSQHNKSILQSNNQIDFGCICQSRTDCPLDNKCKTDNVVYKATITTDNNEFDYIGSWATTFKERYRDHKCSMKNEKYKSKTELASKICEFKNENVNFNLKWKIIARAKPYYIGSKSCNLCLTEKFFILKADKNRIVNHRDLKIKCRHRFKFKLKNI